MVDVKLGSLFKWRLNGHVVRLDRDAGTGVESSRLGWGYGAN